MAVVYEIEHTTTYKYANPVTLGSHRAMFVPRGSHAGRIVGYSVEANVPSTIHWIKDTLSNNVAVIEFAEPVTELIVTCRFVSGYLYDEALDGGDIGMVGSGATHAWLSAFLPGAGWLNYDPTNRITEGFDLIPVAIARHPGQAVPLAGSWFGNTNDYLGMDVNVSVSKQGDIPGL